MGRARQCRSGNGTRNYCEWRRCKLEYSSERQRRELYCQITSTDTNAVLPAKADFVSGSAAFSVSLRTAGTASITATDLDDGTKAPNTSLQIAVAKGPFSSLQVLLPGETAVP